MNKPVRVPYVHEIPVRPSYLFDGRPRLQIQSIESLVRVNIHEFCHPVSKTPGSIVPECSLGSLTPALVAGGSPGPGAHHNGEAALAMRLH
jgi:hypothetical protein